jgi:hypothetical protein
MRFDNVSGEQIASSSGVEANKSFEAGEGYAGKATQHLSIWLVRLAKRLKAVSVQRTKYRTERTSECRTNSVPASRIIGATRQLKIQATNHRSENGFQ